MAKDARAKSRKKQLGRGKKAAAGRAVKGALTALAATVMIVLVLAEVVQRTGMELRTVAIINQTVKLVFAVLAGYVAGSRLASGAVAAGAVAGLAYTVLCFLVFSLVQGGFGDGGILLADSAIGAAMGAAAAFVAWKLTTISDQPRHRA